MAQGNPSTGLNAIIGDEIEGKYKWSCCIICGEGRFIYGIPSCAPRVAKFDTVTNTIIMIGFDFGDVLEKWVSGALAKDGCIYCPPYNAAHILKIDTNNDGVELIVLDNMELPEFRINLWASAALAPDKCVYCMPSNAHRILKIDPASSTAYGVGEDLGVLRSDVLSISWYSGTVVGADGWVYGLSEGAKCIIKLNPANPSTTLKVGKESNIGFRCGKGGVLHSDGCIYSNLTEYGEILKIDTSPCSPSNQYTLISTRKIPGIELMIWGSPIIGLDQCIYWPPLLNADRVLRFDPFQYKYAKNSGSTASLVGDSLEVSKSWYGGALAKDGKMYCMPYDTDQILVIDPFTEFSKELKSNICKAPGTMGNIFAERSELGESFYESSVRKFGIQNLIESLPSDEEWNETLNLSNNPTPLFVVAAAANGGVPLIYELLQRNLNEVVDFMY